MSFERGWKPTCIKTLWHENVLGRKHLTENDR